MPMLGAPVVENVQNAWAQSAGNVFKPPPRARSEASFSEFHYDNSDHPAAGVGSSRLWHDKAKNCNTTLYNSQVSQVIRMTPEQEYNCQFERLDGPRLDPSKMPGGGAGDMSTRTKVKVTLLANHDSSRADKANEARPEAQRGEVKRARGFILDNPSKSKAACAPPPCSTNPLRPPEEKFNRQLKRNGYNLQESRWTWNESHEVTGQDPEFVKAHDHTVVLAGLKKLERKLYTSVKGEKKYNICGAQDMIPAGTRQHATADCPPTQRHIYENDKKSLQGFERGARPKGVPVESKIEYMGESPEMWNCMSGQERPLDKWRSMSARGGQTNWMDSAQQYYMGNEIGRYPPQSARGPQSPGGSCATYDQYQGDMRSKGNRRSVLSSPSEAGYGYRPPPDNVYRPPSDAGSRVSLYSRASTTQSVRELTQPRFR